MKEEPFGEMTLHTCPAAQYGAVLLHATDSKTHLEQLAALARKKKIWIDASGCGARVRVRWEIQSGRVN